MHLLFLHLKACENTATVTKQTLQGGPKSSIGSSHYIDATVQDKMEQIYQNVRRVYQNKD